MKVLAKYDSSTLSPLWRGVGVGSFSFHLCISFLCAQRNETKKGCRGLTCRLRRGAFIRYKGLHAH